jgi:formylmethanofuran--tetrahydromethanopterin N-formyltransferase
MPAEARCAYEIVIDGLTLEAVERATAAGLYGARSHAKDLVALSAGNYGGKLGPYHIRLFDVAQRFAQPS